MQLHQEVRRTSTPVNGLDKRYGKEGRDPWAWDLRILSTRWPLLIHGIRAVQRRR